jgi:hypothetical protein
MRKALIMLVVGGLVVGGLGAPATAKKKKKKPAVVAVAQKYFLRSVGCSQPDVNFDYLSLTDADEEIQCFYTGSGVRNTIGDEVGDVCAPDPLGGSPRCAVASRETATRYFDAIDGIPIVLDTSKTITGSIWTDGGACATALTPCSPAGLGVGQTTFDVSVVGKIGEEETVIGELSDTYQVTPGTVHEVKLDLKIDPALAGKVFDTIELRTWQGGVAVGHGVILTNGDTSSYISIPALVKKK